MAMALVTVYFRSGTALTYGINTHIKIVYDVKFETVYKWTVANDPGGRKCECLPCLHLTFAFGCSALCFQTTKVKIKASDTCWLFEYLTDKNWK